MISLTIGDFGDKNYRSMIFPNIVVLIFLSYLFGYFIYNDIPSKLGGGKPYDIVISGCHSVNTLVAEERLIDTVSVLYENDVRLLVLDKCENILFIEKKEIPAYKILNNKKSSSPWKH